MRTKPILFNTDEVRATLDGSKTVTRRVVKGAKSGWPFEGLSDDAAVMAVDRYGMEYAKPVDGLWATFEDDDGPIDFPMVKAPCRPGDVLYVRETWNYGYFDSSDVELDNSRWFEPLPLDYDRNSYIGSVAGFVYRADFTRPEEYEYGTLDENNVPKPMPWRPSIHMPREAARIFLRVTDVRVERLQEIDEDGAIAEGLYKGWSLTQTSTLAETARQAFVWLWQHLTRKAPVWQGWAANPWVWVIAFERCDAPPQRGVQSATGQSPALSAEKKPEEG